jgi:hypothetical protein
MCVRYQAMPGYLTKLLIFKFRRCRLWQSVLVAWTAPKDDGNVSLHTGRLRSYNPDSDCSWGVAS